MLFDSHVHVGQFYSHYYPPSVISQLMADVGVDCYAVSSTTMCEENYTKVLDEMYELLAFDGDKVFPVMWVTPEGLKGNIAWFLESDIKWKCLKVHPELAPNDWEPLGEQFAEVVDIASELSIPLLIHTGNKDCSLCGKYEMLIKQHPKITFILAHGRPIGEAIHIVSSYNNVYVDTAFMPIDDIIKLVNHGLSQRILWGTDMCIPQHFYPKADMKEYYKGKLHALQSNCTLEEFERITSKNAMVVFGKIE